MLSSGGALQLSASDLIGFLNCHHLTALDFDVANGTVERPKHWDSTLEALWERGALHEQRYIEHLKSQGHQIVEIDGPGVHQSQADQTMGSAQVLEPFWYRQPSKCQKVGSFGQDGARLSCR